MTEARYRGQKVIAVSPDYADNVKFADEWLPAQPGTDGALAMAMGHVILREFFVDRQVPYFTDYVSPVHRPAVPGPARTARGRHATRPASSSPPPISASTDENAAFKTVLSTRPTRAAGRPERLARIPVRRRRRRQVEPRTRRHRARSCSMYGTADPVELLLPRFDEPSGAGAVMRRGVPARRVAGHLVTTVFDLLLADYGVGRRRAARRLADRLRRRRASRAHPAWQEEITSVPASSRRPASGGSSRPTPRPRTADP